MESRRAPGGPATTQSAGNLLGAGAAPRPARVDLAHAKRPATSIAASKGRQSFIINTGTAPGRFGGSGCHTPGPLTLLTPDEPCGSWVSDAPALPVQPVGGFDQEGVVRVQVEEIAEVSLHTVDARERLEGANPLLGPHHEDGGTGPVLPAHHQIGVELFVVQSARHRVRGVRFVPRVVRRRAGI